MGRRTSADKESSNCRILLISLTLNYVFHMLIMGSCFFIKVILHDLILWSLKGVKRCFGKYFCLKFVSDFILIIQTQCFCMKVATGQVASTGMVALSYVQKISEKVEFTVCDTLLLSKENFKKKFVTFCMHFLCVFYVGLPSFWLHVQLHV